MRLHKKCLYCNTALEGRSDKKFCDVHCRSAYQYETTKKNPLRFYDQVDKQLKHNRKVLKKFNRGGQVTLDAQLLITDGFDPNFFTHYWKNPQGEVYLFVYEYGFLKKRNPTGIQYILIRWEHAMKKNFKKY